MLCDSVAAIRAGFQRPYCERMAKGMNSGARKPFSPREANLLDDVVECGFGVMQQQRAPPQGDEHVIIQWGIGTPPQEVSFQANLGGVVNGYETALAEL
jgi:hypothetical protein